jgi:hypothetical protein
MDFEEFMRLQREELEKDRWIESEKARKDLGSSTYMDWIKKHAKAFREYIESKFGPIKYKNNKEDKKEN